MLLGLGLSTFLKVALFWLGGFHLGLKKMWVKTEKQECWNKDIKLLTPRGQSVTWGSEASGSQTACQPANSARGRVLQQWFPWHLYVCFYCHGAKPLAMNSFCAEMYPVLGLIVAARLLRVLMMITTIQESRKSVKIHLLFCSKGQKDRLDRKW